MGTTLTGTTPQDTYDSLIKVTDNGPLSGTAKYLSDGLGNDSALAMSTTAVGVGNAAPAYKLDVTGDIRTSVASGNGSLYINNSSLTSKFWTFIPETAAGETNLLFFYGGAGAGTKMALTNGGNVGIGTSSPTTARVVIDAGAASSTLGTLMLTQSTAGGIYGQLNGCGDASHGLILRGIPANGTTSSFAVTAQDTMGFYEFGGDFRFFKKNGTLTELARIDSDGLKFNGDTAAANALDDYEEGTWTPAIAFGGAAVGVAYVNNSGTYTKIGRQVTVNGYFQLSSKGSSTGSVRITGLPFTIPLSNQNYSAASLWLNNVTFANQFMGLGLIGTTTIPIEELSTLGAISGITDADFANNSEVMVSLTYFV